MAKGALYWRLKDKKTGKWTYQRCKPEELIGLSKSKLINNGMISFLGEE